MAQTYRDPLTYLNESVTKRGKSGPDGVYLHNVTVVAESSGTFDCNVYYGQKVSPITPPGGYPPEDWALFLVNLRWDIRSLSHTLALPDGSLYQFLPEGNSLGLNVFLPTTDVQEFSYHLQMAQDTLLSVADFTSKVAGNMRFSIGVVTKSWVEMAEEGEVEERDLNF